MFIYVYFSQKAWNGSWIFDYDRIITIFCECHILIYNNFVSSPFKPTIKSPLAHFLPIHEVFVICLFCIYNYLKLLLWQNWPTKWIYIINVYNWKLWNFSFFCLKLYKNSSLKLWRYSFDLNQLAWNKLPAVWYFISPRRLSH